MRKPLAMVFASAGSYIGWVAGAKVGLMTGFILAVIGLGAGLYLGGRLASRLVE